MTRPDSTPRPRRRNRGFTLVELLVVLLILAVLIALLIPAIQAAIGRANGAAVQAEINNLAQALTDFKSKYGDYPPSRIVVAENGILPVGASNVMVPSGSNSDVSVGQLATRSLTAFRKFWPRTVFSTVPGSPPSLPSGAGTFYDFNGDGIAGANTAAGVPAGPWILQGHECLVFFLGGIPLNTGGTVSVTGFSKNPANPFMNSVQGNANYSGNRNPPFYEFDGARLQYSLITAGGATVPSTYVNPGAYMPSGMPGYIDRLGSQGSGVTAQNFFMYFSTNLGTGYDPNDCNVDDTRSTKFEVDATVSSGQYPDGLHPITLQFRSVQPTAQPLTASPSPNPYTTGPSVPGNATPQFQNPQTFQIISPGLDGIYGVGGQFSPSSTSALPAPGTATNAQNTAIRQVESDNLTNFRNGRLD